MRTVGTDQKIGYAMIASLLAALLFLLAALTAGLRIAAAVILAVSAVITCLLVKKRSILSFNKRQILLLLSVIAAVYLMLLYMTGIHYGFGHGAYTLSYKTLLYHVIPVAVVIIATEIIRAVLLGQESRLMQVLLYVACVASELCLGAGIGGVTTVYSLMDFVAMTLFPAVTSNLLCHYIAKRYGAAPNIAYRLILALYSYVIPFLPNLPVVFVSFTGIVLPLLSMWFINLLFEKKRRYAAVRKSAWQYVAWGVTLSVMVSVVMLISCQFRYGILMIATPSMTGEINKGDAVVFERYDGQELEEQQVIVFEKREGVKVVHRVVRIETVRGEKRYITKGDFNEDEDQGYVVDSQVVGVVRIKLAYVGYPSLWLRELFED